MEGDSSFCVLSSSKDGNSGSDDNFLAGECKGETFFAGDNSVVAAGEPLDQDSEELTNPTKTSP